MDGLQLIRKQETQDNNINLVTGEVTNARTNAEPFDYDNLKQRLDAMDRNLTSAIEGLEWKPSVPTFGDIAATYPNPKEGWTVSVDDTNEIFRYDETLGQWISIMTSFSTATQTAPGLMSAEDKKKLDGLNSANYVHKNGDVMTGNLTMTNNGKFVGDLEGNSTTTGRLQTPVQINGVNFDGSMNIDITDDSKLPLVGGTVTGVINANAGVVGNLTGNASTATKLQVAKTINGVPFDGSQNIVIEDNTKLPLAGGTITGNLKVDGTITGNLDGNATSSSKLQTPRNINGVPFDGTGDINIAISQGTDVTLGGYNKPGVGGNVNAGDNINQAIGKLEVNLDGKANTVHNHSSNNVTSMNGYTISTTGGAIAPGDSLNVAIGKLEYEIKNKSVSNMTLGGYIKPNSTSPIVQGDTINQAIGKLEYGLDQKAPLVHNQPSNTINALTGYVLAGNNGAITTNDTLNIALAKLENNANGKAPLNHNQGSNTINTMAGYNKGAVGGAITQGDTLNAAIGKLEVNLDNKAATNHNQASNTINAMTGYVKPGAGGAILPGDTLNAAIGKLEIGLDDKAPLTHMHSSIQTASAVRPTSANVPIVGDRTLSMLLATSSMTTGKPNGEGYILNFNWDSTAGWTSQMFIRASDNPKVEVRGMNAGNWGNWHTLYGTNNKPTPAEIGAATSAHTHSYLPLTGGTMTGDVNTNSSINFTANNTGIKHNNNVIISNNGTSTIIGSINNSIFLRPQGYTTTTNQVTIATNGDVTANRFVGNLQGNSATTTRLQTGRRINGVLFDGTGDINIGINPANVNLNGYVKPNTGGAISPNDSFNQAFGKLEVNLDGKANTNHTHTSNNVTALTGYVKGTAGTALTVNDSLNTALSKIEVRLDGKANTNHTHTSNNITGMTGYAKPNATSAIVAGDSLNVAIGKLEFGLDGKANTNHLHDNRYLQLTGGTLTGNVNTNSSINFTNPNTGCIRVNNNLVLRNNGTSTVLSSINNTMYFRPQGDSIATNQATLDTNGNFTANKFVGNLQGNAATATRLQNARTIQLTGAVTGQANFDGSANIQINTTLATQQKGRLVRLTSRVVVNTTTKTVNIGIGAFNVNNDVLNVYLSGVRLEPTVDYTNTQSQITLTGTNNFVNGDVVSFEVIQMQ